MKETKQINIKNRTITFTMIVSCIKFNTHKETKIW